ncbi:MAG: hypothetical protein ACRC0B_02905, partial [Legionella sp.]
DPNFYPNEQTISRAIAAGHHNATDRSMIQEFIDKNTAWGSTFADFNPIYLAFLAKHVEREQKKLASNSHTRNSNSERTSSKVNSYDSAMDEVRKYNQNACIPSEHELFPKHENIWFEPSTCVMGLDGTHQNLRTTFC